MFSPKRLIELRVADWLAVEGRVICGTAMGEMTMWSSECELHWLPEHFHTTFEV